MTQVYLVGSSCTSFLDLLNAEHKNIKFTVEHAAETIPFLDGHLGLDETYTYKSFTENLSPN